MAIALGSTVAGLNHECSRQSAAMTAGNTTVACSL